MSEITTASPVRFNRLAKTLHWVTAFLVILPMLLGFGIIGPGLENMTGDENPLAPSDWRRSVLPAGSLCAAG